MKNNIIFFVCILLFAMLIWFITSIAISYNEYYQTQNSMTSYDDEDDASIFIDLNPIQTETLM